MADIEVGGPSMAVAFGWVTHLGGDTMVGSMRCGAVVLCLVLLSACSGSPVEEAASLADQTALRACDCADEFGFRDRADCIERLGANYTPTQRACLSEAYAQNSSALQPTAMCLLDVARVFNECVNAIVECNGMAFDNCVEESSNGVRACPVPTESASRTLLACTDTDTDGDGIFDEMDRCDTDPEDIDGFQDSDGCPEPDAYNSCVSDSDCQPPTQCDLANEGICTILCSSDSECPAVGGAPGACRAPPFEDFVCFQTCASSEDCVSTSATCRTDSLVCR